MRDEGENHTTDVSTKRLSEAYHAVRLGYVGFKINFFVRVVAAWLSTTLSLSFTKLNPELCNKTGHRDSIPP